MNASASASPIVIASAMTLDVCGRGPEDADDACPAAVPMFEHRLPFGLNADGGSSIYLHDVSNSSKRGLDTDKGGKSEKVEYWTMTTG